MPMAAKMAFVLEANGAPTPKVKVLVSKPPIVFWDMPKCPNLRQAATKITTFSDVDLDPDPHIVLAAPCPHH